MIDHTVGMGDTFIVIGTECQITHSWRAVGVTTEAAFNGQLGMVAGHIMSHQCSQCSLVYLIPCISQTPANHDKYIQGKASKYHVLTTSGRTAQ